ncbi:polysaccharide deacetylase family protein [Methylocella sp.]|uniref:polysaccharide deacetylase family protein n=1 Tax=Methylocella sp. TaxID=1978226 RepID=UPI003784A78B
MILAAKIFFGTAFLAGAFLGGPLLAAPAQAAGCGDGALGVARVVQVGTPPGQSLAVGLKSYPRTLALKDREVVLTFDDGPLPATTTKILDALAAQCVKATFFLVGRNAQANPKLARRIVAEGHTIAHHTFSHQILRNISESRAREEIEKGFRADEAAAFGSGGPPHGSRFFRYPGFADTPELNAWLATQGAVVFGADVWASDWVKMTPQEELELVLKRLEASKGGILLMHDIKAQTAAMLPELLGELKRRGYAIVHLVPGDAPPPLRDAPPGWSSETQKFLQAPASSRATPAPPADLARRPARESP